MFPANHRCWLNNKPFHASGETGCNRRSSFQGKCCNAVYPRCSFAYISSVIRRKSVRSLYPVPGSSIRTFYWTSFFFFFYKHSLWNLILQKVESKFLKREIFFSSLFFIISFKKIEKFWFVKLFKFRFIYNNLITMMVILLKFCFVVKYRKGVDIFRSKIFWVAFILQNMDAALRDCRLSFSMQFPLMRNNFRKQFSRVLLLNVPWNMPKG